MTTGYYVELPSVASDLSTGGLNNIRSWGICRCDNAASCWTPISGDPNICINWNVREILDSVTTVKITFLAEFVLFVVDQEFEAPLSKLTLL